MNIAIGTSLAMALIAHVLPAHAESLRCNGVGASEGDSQLSVLYKCGQPMVKTSFCAPVYHSQALQPLPEPYARIVVPCQQVEQWLYDRGPGNLMATVRFHAGVVQSITYSRVPQ